MRKTAVCASGEGKVPVGRGGLLSAAAVAVVTALASLLTAAVGAAPAAAEETFFNSGKAYREEAGRLAGEGKLFLEGPVTPYWPETLAVAGIFALTYSFDERIRSRLAGAHSGTLTSLSDAASAAGHPALHLGAAALVYGAGAVTDSPRLLHLGEEIGEALFFADSSTLLLREAIGRGRPATGESSSRYRPFQIAKDYDSLPSMHTASSFALAHVLASHSDSLPVQVFCYAAAGFVGFSRVYRQDHWASDVIVGAALGELAGNAVTRYYATRGGNLAVAPATIDGAPALALVGRF